MKLELDLSADDWKDYAQSPIGDLKRVGVVTPTLDVGIRQFVRLGVLADGKPVVVMTPWLIWKAANEALARHLGERTDPEPAKLPGVLAGVQDAMRDHASRWGLDASHPDGTDPEAWKATAEQSRQVATMSAFAGEVTWAHTFIEAADAVMATDDPTQLRQALAAVAGCVANWMTAIDRRADG